MFIIFLFLAISLSCAGKTAGHGHGQLYSAQPRFGWGRDTRIYGYEYQLINLRTFVHKIIVLRIWATPPSKSLFWFVKSKAEPAAIVMHQSQYRKVLRASIKQMYMGPFI